ncbi:hypothetical protein RHMOL_Rhmol02G0276600 [Rhododendron molle]|uniref:Uncharacterized protein n=1 Tax=Rhododendron molle TaxID=49168 RepID=A0ACC0PW67_RHOML|nr:hypothetical protein RHMOL_Rhmol02G0276600 [Rhododendron molle]
MTKGLYCLQTEYGDKYDCVDFYNQPGFDHPLLNNHSFILSMLWLGQELAQASSIELVRRLAYTNQRFLEITMLQVDPDLCGDTRTRAFIRVDDLANGNWWLRIGDDNTPIGFWPKRIFRDLAGSASYVDWGGVVYSPPGTPAPVMASGHFLNRDTKYDAFFRNIQVVNDFGQNVDTFNTETFNDIELYDVADIKNAESFGHLVLYGGPPQ